MSRTYIKWLVNCSLLIIHDIMFQSHNLLILGPFTWRWGTPGRWGNPLRWGNPPFHTISHFILVMFTWWVRVTRQRGFLGLPTWGNPVSQGDNLPCKRLKVGKPAHLSHSWQKAQKLNTYVLKLCTFPSRLMAEITRNRNGHTRRVKCSHFGIFSVVNRPYFVSQTILYHKE